MESSLMKYFVINNELRSTCDFNPYLFDKNRLIYEVIRVEKGIPLFIENHIERFYNSAKLASININLYERQILNKIKALIESNRLITGLIKFIYQDTGDNSGLFSAWVTPFYFPSKEQYSKGVDLSVMYAERDNPSAKYGNFTVRQKADEIIKQKGVYEVLLVNKSNIVTEGSRSNVFFLKKGLDLLFTPHSNIVLNGITRKKVIELAIKNGIDTFESEFAINELEEFNSAFLTGTSPKVLPVSKVDNFDFDVKSPLLRFLPFILLLFFFNNSFSQKKKIPSSFCITIQEKALFDSLNKIRVANGKKKMRLSASLSYVAKLHVKDLQENHPDTSICNLSSWSNKGKWKPCCYNPYAPKPLCIKKKPSELTPYRYYGYEFVSYFEDGVVIDSILALWKDMEPAMDMILTEGKWKEKKWLIAGVGINEHYVSVWFAQKYDALPKPAICKSKTTHKTNNNVSKKESAKPKRIYYYIIYSSLKDKESAKEALRRTKSTGFKNAGIVTGKGNYRVYLNKFDSYQKALSYKKKLSKTYKNTWILKK